MCNDMQQDLKTIVELESRRIIGEETKAYREHLQLQFTFLKRSVGIIVTFFAIVLVFLFGKSWFEMEGVIQGRVDDVFIKNRVEEKLMEKAQSMTGSPDIQKTIRERIGVLIQETRSHSMGTSGADSFI